MSKVGHNSTYSSCLVILSVIKCYMIFICLVLLLLDHPPLFSRFDAVLVILVNNIFVDLISLLFQEVSGPYHLGQYIVHSEKLSLSWTLGVQFLFSILDIGSSCSHGHETTIMGPHVLVYHKFCIKVPFCVTILVYW